MDKDKIIDGLKMTMDLFTFDPTTGEEKDPDDLNDLDRATYDACKGALEILERLDTDSDTISRAKAIDGKICIQRANGVEIYDDYVVPVKYLEQLPPAQSEPSQVAKDIARIVDNGQGMRVIAQPDIIRCRNCKFASGDSRICMKFGHSPIGELDFCAWAERRTDE